MNNTPEELYLKHAEESALPLNLQYIYLFSKEAADKFGYINAQTIDGKAFQYTEMHLESEETSSAWKDFTIVGKFMKEEVRYLGTTQGSMPPLDYAPKLLYPDILDLQSQIEKIRKDIDLSTLGLNLANPKPIK